ncbi:MAG: DUF3656 domain-containing protein [Lachnospiraceae bacterium]|nr:DUF3656 domain-containing protein [Lachnospiraceae bacterium]
MKKIEILAPAGSLESLYAACGMGGDAVYVGTSRFGARAFADNPTVAELEKALTFAHLRDKRLYLTVNTLLRDRELEQELYPMIQPLYEAGLDACIVQDMGVLSFLHENFPDLPLHASTQMTLFSGEEANLLKPFGVTRYVPARELSIEEIREARKQTDLEIEVFVHGALCYCYSGQCLMSDVIGGRSGNRGMCAQPCRLPWKIVGDVSWNRGCPLPKQKPSGREAYFLSTKDICTLAYIPELVEAGIDSFKIEGRMKRKEYSAYTASVYRKYADLYQSQGKEAFQELRDNPDSALWQDYRRCQDIYNRGGFSNSYLFEKDKRAMFDTKRNGHYGTLAGEVSETGRGWAKWLAKERIHPQDVLEFRDEESHTIYEYTAGDGAKPGEVITANVGKHTLVRTGHKLYRTKNAALLQAIQEDIRLAQEEKYPLEGKLVVKQGEPVRMTVIGKGVSVTEEGEMVLPAKNQPVDKEALRAPLAQLGSTNYVWSDLSISVEPAVFLPLGSLKKLRRQAIARWEEAVAKEYCKNRRRISEKPLPPKDREKKEQLRVVSLAGVSQLKAALSVVETEVLFHLKLEDLPVEEWAEAARLLKDRRAALSLPRIFRGKAKKVFEREWKEEGGVFTRLPLEALIINSFAMLVWAGKQFPSIRWYADTNLYQENQRAKEAFCLLGVHPSPVREYGRIPVMVSEGCVAGGRTELLSPKGDKFTVVNHCKYCYNTIYTGEPFRSHGESRQKRLDFTWEQEDEIRKVIREWNF